MMLCLLTLALLLSSSVLLEVYLVPLLIFFFFAFLCLSLVILLLKVAPKHSTEVLSIVPKCLTERIGNLQPGMSYSAVDHEFSH